MSHNYNDLSRQNHCNLKKLYINKMSHNYNDLSRQNQSDVDNLHEKEIHAHEELSALKIRAHGRALKSPLKNLVFFTNCQGKFIYDNYLSKIDFFNNCEVTFVRNFNIQDIDYDIIYKADMFIYQPVNEYTIGSDKNKKYLIPLLKKDCIKISFPCLYADIFPLYDEGGIVGGDIIEKYKNLGFSLDKILELFDNDELFFNQEKRFKKSLEYLMTREKFCNIKVSDFILKYYKDINYLILKIILMVYLVRMLPKKSVIY